MKKYLHKFCIAISAVLLLALVGLDQWTKALAETRLKGNEPFSLINGVLELHYFENTGAAWGMLKGRQTFFYVLTLCFCALVLWEIYRLHKKQRFFPFVYTLVLMLAGALGNFIDRLTNQYVVDFIYFKCIDFPIFNVADCYITISVVLIMLFMLFGYTEEEFDEILPIFSKGKKKD